MFRSGSIWQKLLNQNLKQFESICGHLTTTTSNFQRTHISNLVKIHSFLMNGSNCKLSSRVSMQNHLYLMRSLKSDSHTQILNKNFNRFLKRNEIQTIYSSFKRKLSSISKNKNFSAYQRRSAKSTAYYFTAFAIFMVGVSYACVPMYKVFCQATGIGGDPLIGHRIDLIETMEPVRERNIVVTFNADRHSYMKWNFKPAQTKIEVVPGETALAFYTAENPTDEPVIGVATYNVLPYAAANYFNKIQCFCFEQQWLDPHEKVELPVFFYIDPEYDNDPELAGIDNVVLSYTFFKAEKGFTLPLPGFMTQNTTEAAV